MLRYVLNLKTDAANLFLVYNKNRIHEKYIQYNNATAVSQASWFPFWSHCTFDNQYKNLSLDKKSVNTCSRQRSVHFTDAEDEKSTTKVHLLQR